MSDPANRLERVQRRVRRHLYRHPSSPARVLQRLLLDTASRRRRARSCSPYCPCADVMPACEEWMGLDEDATRWRRGGHNPFTVYRDVYADKVLGPEEDAQRNFVGSFRESSDAQRAVDAVNQMGAGPGLTVDGDVVVGAIAEAVPRLLADDVARQIGEDALRNCVAAGMTVLRGPGSKPWTPPVKGGDS